MCTSTNIKRVQETKQNNKRSSSNLMQSILTDWFLAYATDIFM